MKGLKMQFIGFRFEAPPSKAPEKTGKMINGMKIQGKKCVERRLRSCIYLYYLTNLIQESDPMQESHPMQTIY